MLAKLEESFIILCYSIKKGVVGLGIFGETNGGYAIHYLAEPLALTAD